MRSAIRVFVAALVAGTLAGCVPTVDGTSPEPPPVTAPEPAPVSAGSAIELEERGPGDIFVRIDPDALEPTFYAFVTTNPDDPYYHFHTNQSDLFLSIELYTQYGPGWTGQQGTYFADCTANGICIYLDVDGAGPEPVLGPATGGQITMSRLENGYDLTLAGISFPGYTLANMVLIG